MLVLEEILLTKSQILLPSVRKKSFAIEVQKTENWVESVVLLKLFCGRVDTSRITVLKELIAVEARTFFIFSFL